MKRILLGLLLALGLALHVGAANRFVSTTGSGTTCTFAAPCTLTNALTNGGGVTINAGDVVYLRGIAYGSSINGAGSYDFNGGELLVTVSGTAQAPIQFRAYPGEWAVINKASTGAGNERSATLRLNGNHDLIFGPGLVSRCSMTESRVSAQDGTAPTDITRGGGALVPAGGGSVVYNVWIVNSVQYDNSDSWGGATNKWRDSGMYGDLTLATGWLGNTDRGHGHGYYLQTGANGGLYYVLNSVSCFNFDNGMQAYGSSAAYVYNLIIQNNLHYLNGEITYGITGDGIHSAVSNDFLIGTDGTGQLEPGMQFSNNYTYAWDIGLRSVTAKNMLSRAADWTSAIINSNYIAGGTNSGGAVPGFTPGNGGYHWINPINGSNFSWGIPWQSGSIPAGSPADTWTNTKPNTLKTVVIPANKWAPGEGFVAIYNWGAAASPITVNISSLGLLDGQTFDGYPCSDFPDGRTTNGTYSAGTGTFAFPVTTAAQPVYLPKGGIGSLTLASSPAPEFSCYKIVPTSMLSFPP